MIHKSAVVSKSAIIGKNVTIWAYSQVRKGVRIGDNCVFGRNVYIDHEVKIGSNVKVQNNALIYFETIIGDNVFVGPAATLINDKYPKATNPEGKLLKIGQWDPGKIVVKKGASIGAGAIVLPDVEIGAYSLVGSGSVVTKSVTAFGIVAGNPAKLIGYICPTGHRMGKIKIKNVEKGLFCKKCSKNYKANE